MHKPAPSVPLSPSGVALIRDLDFGLLSQPNSGAVAVARDENDAAALKCGGHLVNVVHGAFLRTLQFHPLNGRKSHSAGFAQLGLAPIQQTSRSPHLRCNHVAVGQNAPHVSQKVIDCPFCS